MDNNPNGRKKRMLVLPLTSKSSKGYITADWDIRLKKSLPKKKLDELVEDLLTYVGTHPFPAQSKTVSLKFQLFKSVDNPLLYNLKVFRTMKSTSKEEAPSESAEELATSAFEGPTKTSGPKIPPPPRTETMEIVAPQV